MRRDRRHRTASLPPKPETRDGRYVDSIINIGKFGHLVGSIRYDIIATQMFDHHVWDADFSGLLPFTLGLLRRQSAAPDVRLAVCTAALGRRPGRRSRPPSWTSS